MKSPKEHFQSSLGKPTFILTAMAASLLFLVQCRVSNVEDFGFQEDIKKHFGDMNYAKTVFANNVSSRDKVAVDYQRGSGILTDREGKELKYKWAYLIGENGDLLSGYIGTSRMSSTTTVALTRDEVKARLKSCAKENDKDKRFACFDMVVDEMVNDCENISPGDSDCSVHCFYNLERCD